MNYFRIFLPLVFLTSASYAKVNPTEKVSTQKPAPMGGVQVQDVTIQVKGMVCGFCAQGIEKNLKALPEVSTVKVSLENKKVEIDIKDGKSVSDDQLKKIINEAGYDVVSIERAK